MPPPRPPEPVFDPKAMLRTLSEHDVRYILIGGVAATLHASPYQTIDLDICPARDGDNLERLAAALNAMEAGLRVTDEPEPLRVELTAHILRAAPIVNLMTRWGPLDVVFRPAGTEGYEDLRREVVTVKLGDVEVEVASRADVLRSKEAVYRDKDRLTVQLLRELEERDRAKKPRR
ncbi:MAG: hypothetical protein ACRDKZ_01460 [Actinomycetota bacterium]